MNDEVLDDDQERAIEVAPRPDWLDNSEAVQGFAGITIPSPEVQRANGGSGSASAPTPKRSRVALPLDTESDAAHSWRSIELRRRAEEEARRRREEEEREDRLANAEAAAIAAEAARLSPKPKYTPKKGLGDPEMKGDAVAETILTRRDAIMKWGKPRTFVLPEKGMLVCSGRADTVLILESGDAKLLTLGEDFGYNPETKQWVTS